MRRLTCEKTYLTAMLEFLRLGKNVQIISEYMQKSEVEFCDYSVGAKYLWRDEFVIDYAIYNDTLIMKETCEDYYTAFYYPIGKDVEGALLEIERFCKENNLPLFFCCIDNERASELSKRYPFAKIISERDWSDYIYLADNFKTYSGKKFSGQRNHVNKFKKLYPNYKFSIYKDEDFSSVSLFIDEYVKRIEKSSLQKEECEKLRDYLMNLTSISQVGGIIKVDEKVVAISFGERVKDTLIVHVEKGLREYQGVYPTMASEFAKAFAVDGVKFINREEDCGDMGLRISKLQYHPIEVKEKNNVEVLTAFENIPNEIKIKTENLLLEELSVNDKNAYRDLYLDDELNKFWGYDYREDLGENQPTADYFYNFNKMLRKNKEELSLLIKKEGTVVGEVVLHEFDFYGGVEIGFRISKEHQNKGYAFEAVSNLIDYVKKTIKPININAKCFKENSPSEKLLIKLGFTKVSKDEKYFYFTYKG